MTAPELIRGDNLNIMADLARDGHKFDLIELDGPYGAGLEDWDNLTEAEYLTHYIRRLAIARELLKPWGVLFMFGYPEGCAEVKSWAHRTHTLYLRRWLTWYKQVTAHKGRKVETILLFCKDQPANDLKLFGQYLRLERMRQGLTLTEIGSLAGRQWWHRGGNLYFENGNGDHPSLADMLALSEIFGFALEDWPGIVYESYKGLTDIDFIGRSYPEDTKQLNDIGLRAKPVQLYIDLFKPTIPPFPDRSALILYGGSGNAGIAAGALDYEVTICESSAFRCTNIAENYKNELPTWQERLSQLELFKDLPPADQFELPLFE